MQGRHYKYLTNAFVEWLGLKSFVYEHPHPFLCVWVSENAQKPMTMRGFDRAVVYNHGLYLREPDGLAWSLKR